MAASTTAPVALTPVPTTALAAPTVAPTTAAARQDDNGNINSKAAINLVMFSPRNRTFARVGWRGNGVEQKFRSFHAIRRTSSTSNVLAPSLSLERRRGPQ